MLTNNFIDIDMLLNLDTIISYIKRVSDVISTWLEKEMSPGQKQQLVRLHRMD
jgi:hypothetical protein